MKTLYPSIPSLQKIAALSIAVFLFGAAYSQDLAYVKTSSNGSTSVSVKYMEPVIHVKMRTERQIVLSWIPFKGAVSHYVVERSVDGQTFQEVGLFFTGTNDWESEPEYFYTDKFHRPYSGPLYYRLRVVGQEGSVYYTPPTILNAE
jgi:hypothetical protein